MVNTEKQMILQGSTAEGVSFIINIHTLGFHPQTHDQKLEPPCTALNDSTTGILPL